MSSLFQRFFFWKFEKMRELENENKIYFWCFYRDIGRKGIFNSGAARTTVSLSSYEIFATQCVDQPKLVIPSRVGKTWGVARRLTSKRFHWTTIESEWRMECSWIHQKKGASCRDPIFNSFYKKWRRVCRGKEEIQTKCEGAQYIKTE